MFYHLVRSLSSRIRRLAHARFSLKSSLRTNLILKGSYGSFEEAYELSGGYDKKIILEKVEASIIDLLNGLGAYERDGTLFIERPPSLAITRLLKECLQPSDVIVDYGGGLGGTFLNHPDIFVSSLEYYVVEQQNYVDLGNKIATSYGLKIIFLKGLDQLPVLPNIVILSSVLQYVPNSLEVLGHVASLKPRSIIIDRTAFSANKDVTWYIQVEPNYYGVPIGYPMRPLDKSSIISTLAGYKLVEQWHNPFDPDYPRHGGLLFQKCA